MKVIVHVTYSVLFVSLYGLICSVIWSLKCTITTIEDCYDWFGTTLLMALCIHYLSLYYIWLKANSSNQLLSQYISQVPWHGDASHIAGHLWGEFTCDHLIPLTKNQWCGTLLGDDCNKGYVFKISKQLRNWVEILELIFVWQFQWYISGTWQVSFQALEESSSWF